MKRWARCRRRGGGFGFKIERLSSEERAGNRPRRWIGRRLFLRLTPMGQPLKADARDEIRRRLGAFSAEGRRQASGAVFHALTARPEWKAAGILGLYLSLPDEPETRSLIQQAWTEGKKVALPKTDIRAGLTWWEIQPGPLPVLETLWEPLPGKYAAVGTESIEGFCVPGRAFDAGGTRLRRGGGHYDRALAQRSRRAWVMGLFFGIQEMENLPREAHDVPLSQVVTEHGWRSLP